jgi:hypothetical protein
MADRFNAESGERPPPPADRSRKSPNRPGGGLIAAVTLEFCRIAERRSTRIRNQAEKTLCFE